MKPPFKSKLVSNITKYLFVLSFFAISQISYSQAIKVTTQVLPPYSQYISDYQSRPGQIVITLINTTRQSYQVQLVGSITGDNGVSIRTKVGYKSATPVLVNPSATVRVSSNDILQLFDEGALDFTGISSNDIVSKNTLPEGMYQICVQALDYQSLQPLSAEEPQGCSAPFILQSLEPPIIIKPIEGDTLNALLGAPQNIIFTWTTPASAPPSTQYNLKIFERFDANRNPNDLIRTAGLALFDQNIRGNSFIYGPGQPALRLGRSYVAVIQAVDLTRRSSVFRNEGYSEPVTFQFGRQPVTIAGGGTTPPTPGSIPIPSEIPATQIKGKILWTFKKKMNVGPIGPFQEVQFLPNFSIVESMKYAMDVNYNGLNNPNPSAPAPPQNMGMFVKNSIFNGLNSGGPSLPNSNYLVMGGINGYQAKIKSARNYSNILTGGVDLMDINSNEKYPLVNTKVSIYAIKIGAKVDASPNVGNLSTRTRAGAFSYISKSLFSPNKVLIGAGITDAEGNFVVDFLNPSLFTAGYDRLSVEITSKDFSLPNAVFPMPKVGADGQMPAKDLGEIFGVAFNFNFIPRIVDEAGKEIKNIYVKVYRRTDFYNLNPNQKKEGNIQFASRKPATEKEISGELMEVGRQTSNGNIFHLFYNQNFNERYYVVIKKEGYQSIVTDLMVTPTGQTPDVIDVNREFEFLLKLPTIKGTVELVKDGIKSPIRGATVTLYMDDSWKNQKNPSYLLTNFSNRAYLTNYNALNTIKKPGGSNILEIPNKIGENADAYNKMFSIGPGNPAGSYYASRSSATSLLPVLLALSNTMVATTDSNGAFIFTDIPLSKIKNKYYHLVTTAPAITKIQIDSALCDTRGVPDIIVPILISPTMIAVIGKTVDDKGTPIGEPFVKWKSDGRTVSGGVNGAFLTKNVEGIDTLIITKYGYAEKRLGVNVKKPVSGGGGKGSAGIYASLISTATFNSLIVKGNPPLPSNFGYFVNTNFNNVPLIKNIKKGPNDNYEFLPNYADDNLSTFSGLSPPDYAQVQFAHMFDAVFTATEEPEGVMDLGNIVLQKKVGKIRFTVKDATTSAPLPNVKILLPNFEIDGVTNPSGQWYIEGPGGNVLADAIPNFGSGYITKEVEVITKDDGSVTDFTILLNKGIKVTGKVTSAGVNIKDANVLVDGREFITTKSAADGSYSLIVPAGEFTLKASKSGYLGVQATRTFVIGTDQVVNLALGDAGGKDLTKMLGFEIEVESMTPNGAGSFLTGSFINFKPMGPFKVVAGKKLKFTNIAVTWDGAGKPQPAGNQVLSTETQLDFKVFDFLPLRVNRPGGILVKKDVANKGVVQGIIEISVDQILGSTGFQFPAGFKPNLTTLSASVPTELSVFTEDGSFPYGAEFFMGTAEAMVGDKFEESKLKIKLFNFEARIDLGKCSIKGDGLHLVGGLKTTGIPLLGDRTFEFEQFHIGADFGIKAVSVKLIPPPTLTIVSWSATLNSMGFNENGFKVGGSIKVKVPASAESIIDFANLLFGQGTVFGGSFTLPTDGVDIFGVIQMKPGATPLSFGRLNNSSVFYIAGSGKFKLPKLIDYTLNVKSFQIQTDAKFAATVEANLNVSLLGVCQLQIIDIGFSTLGPSPEINVNGAFKLTIPFFKATVGGIHYKPGGSVSVDELGIGFDIVGIAKVEVHIKFVDTPARKGFEGKGKLAITGTPVNASMGFHYYKLVGGIEVGAEFEAGVIIPIGVITLERIGGGFNLNTAENKFYVRIEAAASFAGTGPLIKLDPVRVEVWSGPVIKGTVGVIVASVINTATAVITIDVPNSYFAVGIDMSFAPLGDFASARAQGDLIISAKSDNKYFFFGVGFDVNLLGLIQARGGVAIGAGLRNAKAHERAGYYLASAPDQFLTGGTFSGIYVYGSSHMGVDKAHAWGFDAGICSAKAWLYNESMFHFIANFNNGDFEVRAKLRFGGGVEACVVGLCAGGELAACLDLAGGRDGSRGWYFHGMAGGYGSIYAGCDSDCNDIGWWGPFPCGFKICVGAKLNIDYESKGPNRGLGVGFALGGSNLCN